MIYTRFLLLLIYILASFCFIQGNGLENNDNNHDINRALLGIEDAKISVGEDEQVIILSMSTVWFKGLIAMNIAIFIAVMIIFVIQCKKCLNNCMNGRGRYRRRRYLDKYDKLQLTTDVTEFDTTYEDDQTDV